MPSWPISYVAPSSEFASYKGTGNISLDVSAVTASVDASQQHGEYGSILRGRSADYGDRYLHLRSGSRAREPVGPRHGSDIPGRFCSEAQGVIRSNRHNPVVKMGRLSVGGRPFLTGLYFGTALFVPKALAAFVAHAGCGRSPRPIGTEGRG